MLASYLNYMYNQTFLNIHLSLSYISAYSINLIIYNKHMYMILSFAIFLYLYNYIMSMLIYFKPNSIEISFYIYYFASHHINYLFILIFIYAL